MPRSFQKKTPKSHPAKTTESVSKLDPSLPILDISACKTDQLKYKRWYENSVVPFIYAKTPHLSELAKTGEYPKLELPEEPSPTETNRAILSVYANRVKSIEHDRKALEKDKIILYGFLKSALSPNSEDAMKNEPEEYEKYTSTADPRLLLLHARKIHETVDAANDDEETDHVEQSYERCSHNSQRESISDYKDRFLACIRRKEETKGCTPLPDEKTLARRFVQRLDDREFSEWKKELRDKAVSKGVYPYPTTVLDAYRIAAKRRNTKLRGYPEDLGTTNSVERRVLTLEAKIKKASKKEKDFPKEKQHAKDKDEKNTKPRYGNQNKEKTSTYTKKSNKKCALCDSTEHWTQYCPMLDKAKDLIRDESKAKQVHSIRTQIMEDSDSSDDEENDEITRSPTTKHINMLRVYKIKTTSTERNIILDTGADISVFSNTDLLQDVRQERTETCITGINGQALRSKEIGTIARLNIKALVLRDCGVNILSWKAVVDSGLVMTWDQQSNSFSIRDIHGENMLFSQRRRSLYIHRVEPQPIRALITSAEGNEANYTKHEVTKAQAARRLQAIFGYAIGNQRMKTRLNIGIQGNHITPDDLDRANAIYGTQVPKIRGTTTCKTAHKVPIHRPLTVKKEEQSLYMDIFWCHQLPFLLCLLKPICFPHVVFLRSRTGKTILAEIDHLLQMAYKRGYTINYCEFDGEGGFATLKDELSTRFSSTNRVGPGQHVAAAEVEIRSIKNIVRSICFAVPHVPIPSILIHYVLASGWILSMYPRESNNDPTSGLEKFRGALLHKDRDLRIPTGQYAEFHDFKHPRSNATDVPRSNGGIALYPTGNRTGTWTFWDILSWKTIDRQHFTEVPWGPAAIATVNSHAKESIPRDLNFRRSELGEATEDDPIMPDTTPAAAPLAIPVQPPIPGEAHAAAHDDGMVETVQEGAPEPEPIEAITATDLTRIEDLSKGEAPEEDPPIEDLPPLITDDSDDEDGDPPLTPANTTPRKRGKPIPVVSTYNLRPNPKPRVLSAQISEGAGYRKYGAKAVAAAMKEAENLHNKEVFEPVIRPPLDSPNSEFLPTSMPFKEKYTSTGEFEKLKARMVVGGHRQDRSLYSKKDTSSPTPRTESGFIVLTLAAHEGRYTGLADVPAAYLNAFKSQNTPTTYVKFSRGMTAAFVSLDQNRYSKYVDKDGYMWGRLSKALYGGVDSGKLWNDTFDGFISSQGFVRNEVDVCVYNGSDNFGNQITVVVYVDDILATCINRDAIEDLFEKIRTRFDGIVYKIGDKFSYLGITVQMERDRRAVRLTMEHYVEELLKDTGTCRGSPTPATSDMREIDEKSEPLEKKKVEVFHSTVARLLYLAKKIRHDLLVSVTFLATRVKSPSEQDQGKLARVLRYVFQTKHLGLTLEGDGRNITHDIDVSFAVHKDMKSHTGDTLSLGKGAIHSGSTKQSLVTKSSAEGELVGLSDAANEALWTRQFLISQGIPQVSIIIHQDNQSTIDMIHTGRHTSGRSRHIQVRHYWLYDNITTSMPFPLTVKYKPTSEMTADVLTKPLQGEQFRKLRNKLLNCDT